MINMIAWKALNKQMRMTFALPIRLMGWDVTVGWLADGFVCQQRVQFR